MLPFSEYVFVNSLLLYGQKKGFVKKKLKKYEKRYNMSNKRAAYSEILKNFQKLY